MRRRQALHLLAGAGAGLAGCLGRTTTPGADSPTDSPTDSPGATGTSGGTADIDDGQLAVLAVEHDRYAVRLNDMGESLGGRADPVADLSPRRRDVVTAAIDDGYSTEDPPDWLQEFLSSTRFVKRDGAFYRLSHDLPRTELTAEAVAESEVDGEIADYGTYEAAVTHDGLVMSGLMRTAKREGVELIYVWPSLDSFLEEYDAVRYRGDVLDFSTSVDDPGAPYEVTAEEASLGDLARGPVWDARDEPDPVRSLIRAAGETSGLYSFSDLPEGLFENLDDHEYVYLDGTFYTTYVEKREPLPASVSAEFRDDSLDGDGATLEMAVHNDGTEPIRVQSGAPRPFGVLHFHPAGETEPNHLLWSDAYEESGHVHTEGRDVRSINAIGLTTELDGGESARRSFTVLQSDLPAGEYVVEDSLGIGIRREHAGSLPYRIRFVVG
jgi:hypothetical protein